jgi:gliding motility-associated-like protein
VKVEIHNVKINTGDDFTICAGDTVTLEVVSLYPGQEVSYNWSPAEYIVSGAGTPAPQVYITDSVMFHIESSNPWGCSDHDSILVMLSDFSMYAGDVIPFMYDTIFESQSVTLPTLVSAGLQFQWWPAEGLSSTVQPSVVASPVTDTWYHLLVSDAWGCFRRDSVLIVVEEVYCDEDHLFVPSGFSPNGDQQNDMLFVNSRMTGDIHFMIFSRWGELLFETRDASVGWDGTYKGADLAPGVFIYYLKADCWDGTLFEKRGNITLIR